MGTMFTIGETKKRPGVYQRYEINNDSVVAGALDGIVAVTFSSNWGETGKVYSLSSVNEVESTLGNSGTVQIVKDLFVAGAQTVLAVRLGSNGTKGTVNLKDTSSTPIDALTVTAKSVGSREFKYTLKSVLGATMKEFALYEGTTCKEKFNFVAGGDEVSKLIEAAKNSVYFNFTAVSGYDGTGIFATVSTATEITAGTDPSEFTNADYSNALSKLEAYTFNTICVDSVDATVSLLLANFVERLFDDGKRCFAVIADPLSVEFDTRISNARTYNSYNVIYVGSGFVNADGESITGYRAAAYVAAYVAKTPSNESVTHSVIEGAYELPEMLTNSQYEQCIDSGMLVFSMSDTGSVWIESGITTLTDLSTEDDEGWKKINRTKIRFEMMQRVENSVAALIGKIPNNADGHSNVIELSQKVLDEMIAEGKLLYGANVALDTTQNPVGDSAWFVITADDIETIEKVYQTFRFRYAG